VFIRGFCAVQLVVDKRRYTVTYFLKYFRAKFREILMTGSREIGVFPRVQFHSIAIFLLTAHVLHLIGFFR